MLVAIERNHGRTEGVMTESKLVQRRNRPASASIPPSRLRQAA